MDRHEVLNYKTPAMISSYHLEDFGSSFSIPGSFMIDRFEDIIRPKRMLWPHKHSFYEILWIEQGTSHHMIDQHSFELSDDHLFFIAPGQVHELDQSEDVKGYSIMFTEEFLSLGHAQQDLLAGLSFLENSYSRPSFRVDQTNTTNLASILQSLHQETGRKDKSEPIIRHLLLAFLFNIQRLMSDANRAENDNISVLTLKRFRKLIEEHYKKETRLSFFASQLFITVPNLNEISKKITGKTAGELIRERILLEAKRMLIHSHESIGQIAANLGFKDFSYFSRQFKKQEGISPAAFKKQKFTS